MVIPSLEPSLLHAPSKCMVNHYDLCSILISGSSLIYLLSPLVFIITKGLFGGSKELKKIANPISMSTTYMGWFSEHYLLVIMYFSLFSLHNLLCWFKIGMVA